MRRFRFLMFMAFIFAAALSLRAEYPFASGTLSGDNFSPNTFTGGKGYYEVAYAGLGNRNEVLYFAEYKQTAAGKLEITYKLVDNASGANITKYISAIHIYARPYLIDNNAADDDGGLGTQLSDGQTKILLEDRDYLSCPITYLHAFDSRDPVEKDKVINAAFNATAEYPTIATYNLGTFDVPAAGVATTVTTTAELAEGNWIIYLTADITDFEVVDYNALPYLYNADGSKNLTQIGGQITTIGGTAITASKPVDDGSMYPNSHSYSTMSDATWSSIQNSGSRVLVPRRYPIFKPGDGYSKFYRIPVITSSSDGKLLAISDARKHHIHDIANDIDQVARISEDNGRSWSNPVTIYKGVASADGENYCSTSSGYGDAAVATLPNGAILVTTISGVSLWEDGETRNYYKFSYDNGKSWTEPKQIEIYNTDGTLNSELTNAKACIAPGNMCVVRGGHYAGQVLACFREYIGGLLDSDTQNYVLAYNPATDRWTVLDFWAYTRRALSNFISGYETSKIIKPANSSDADEAHIIEIADDYFVISFRENGSTYRKFSFIEILSEDFTFDTYNVIGTKNGTATVPKGSIGMFTRDYTVDGTANKSFGTGSNSDALTYHATISSSGKPYLITPLVSNSYKTYAFYKTFNWEGNTISNWLESAEDFTTRTSLTMYYSDNFNNENLTTSSDQTINWKSSINISDPFGDAINENAQYCSITEQSNATIGVLFEEYPFGIRKEDTNCNNPESSSDDRTGDFFSNIMYMNLRIGDIIPGATPDETEQLLAPVITPETKVYELDANNGIVGWESIAISHENPAETVTHFSVEAKPTGSETFVTLDYIANGPETFTGTTSLTLDDTRLLTLLTENKIAIENGMQVRVNAYCTLNGYTQSYSDTEIYTFVKPAYKIVLKGYPTGSSEVEMTIANAGSYGNAEEGVVGEGMYVTFLVTPKAGYTFDAFKFYNNGTPQTELSSVTGISYTQISPLQASFTFSSSALANAKENDVYTFYAVCTGDGTAGLNTKMAMFESGTVNTNARAIGYNTAGEIEGTAIQYGYSYWITPNSDNTSKETINDYLTTQPTSKDFNLGGSTTRDNSADYTHQVRFKNYTDPGQGIHVNVSVLPDVFTAEYYGGLVAVRQGDNYLKCRPWSYDASTGVITDTDVQRYVYILLNNPLRHFTPSIAAKAYRMVDWATINSDGLTATPKVANDKPAHDEYPIAWDWGDYGDTYYTVKEMVGVKFPRIDKYDGFDAEAFKNGTDLYVDVFVVSPTETSAEDVIEKGNYLFKVSHQIKFKGDIETSVESVGEDSNELHIGRADGGANFYCAEELNVNVYNTLGVLVKSFMLNGSEYVELPQGVYIANGKKFIVF